MHTRRDNYHLCRIGRYTSFLGMASFAVALSACTTTNNNPEPNKMSRTMSDTAPADLQLLCADAAKASAPAGSSALPVASRKLDGTTYQVDLNVNGETKACVISDAGTVVSVQAS